jgi:hypothetical protein
MIAVPTIRHRPLQSSHRPLLLLLLLLHAEAAASLYRHRHIN